MAEGEKNVRGVSDGCTKVQGLTKVELVGQVTNHYQFALFTESTEPKP
jgi:hypothetical protein